MTTDDDLAEQIGVLLREAFKECRSVAGESIPLGYAVLTDDDATMFLPVMGIEREKFREFDPEDVRFDPTFWDVTGAGSASIKGSRLLDQLSGQSEDWDNDEHWHVQFRCRSFQLLVRCLERLVAEGFFAAGLSEPPFVILWCVDSDVPNTHGRAWCKRLNGTSTYERFVKWLDKKYLARV